MSQLNENGLSGNNSTLQPAAQSSEMDYMTSLQVAELTGKQHSNIMRDIRNLLEQLEDRGAFNFELTSYTDKSNRQSSCYLLTKKDSLLLASGYDANLRAKIIDRWEELETKERNGGYQVPTSFKEALLLAAHQQGLIEEQQKQIEQKEETIQAQSTELQRQAPKVKVYEDYISSTGTYTSTQIAKEYGWGAETLNRKLRELGIQYKQNGQWLLYAKYDGKGYTKSIPRTYTKSDGTTGTQMQTVWTSKGREFIHSLF